MRFTLHLAALDRRLVAKGVLTREELLQMYEEIEAGVAVGSILAPEGDVLAESPKGTRGDPEED